MEKLKALLLPLALVFGAIAVFETGARYGATNMRAHAIASELQLPLGIYVQGQSTMNEQSLSQWTMIIDNGIAAGAIHRKVWHLNKDAKAALDKVLSYALSVRGDEIEKRFELMAHSDESHGFSQAKLEEIRSAVREAKLELVDNAPSLEETEAASTPEN